MKILLIILSFFIFTAGHNSTLLEKRLRNIYKEYDQLMLWVKKNSSLNINIIPPKIIFLSKEKLQKLSGSDIETLALYNRETKTILFQNSFDISRQFDKSILLHEMIHHYQYMNKMVFQCIGEREFHAYAIQKNWMEQRGMDFHKLVIGPLLYLTIQHCPLF